MISVTFLQVFTILKHIHVAGETGSQRYQGMPRRVACALQKPPREELDRLQKQQIIASQDVDETSELCKTFILVPKANGKVRLCLDLARLNKVLMRLIDRCPTLNDILPRLPGVKYLMILDRNLGYLNLK